jgi:mevalonate pyrophosphate decarboxylase
MAGAASSVAVAAAVSDGSASGAAAQPDSTSAETPIRAKAADALRSFKVPPELFEGALRTYFRVTIAPEIASETHIPKLYIIEMFD